MGKSKKDEKFSEDQLFELTPEAQEEKKKEKAERKLNGSKRVTKTLLDNVIHYVRHDDRIMYLIKDNGKLKVKEYIEFEKQVCIPKQDLPIKFLEIDILKESLDIDDKKLLEDIITFLKTYLEMPHKDEYLILASWVVHTYMSERFSCTPILYFHGVKETGKTRAGEVLAEIAYKCERMTSPTESTLFRSASYFKTSLVIDEIKLWGRDGNLEVANLIKSRYKRGLKVSRINLNKAGEDQLEYFDVFAPLVIASTEALPDIIESRCLTFLMRQNSKRNVEQDIDEKKAKDLRYKLTIWRSNNFKKELPNVKQIARGRLNEITRPLQQILMMMAPTRIDDFKDYINIVEMKKADEGTDSLEAEIVRVIVEYYKVAKDKVMSTKDIVIRINGDRAEKDKLKTRFISDRVKRLGFENDRVSSKLRGYTIDPEHVKKLALTYRIPFDED